MKRGVPVKLLYRVVDERGGEGSSLPLMSVSLTRGVVPRSDISESEGRADDLSNYKVCRPGDIVINRMSAYQGALGLSHDKGLVSPDYLVLRPNKDVSASYLTYLFKSKWFVGEMTRRLRGIGSTEQGNVRTPRINSDDLGLISIKLPTSTEQQTIADYLDIETARIDLLLEKKQRMCDLMHLRRRALVELYLGEASFPKWKLGRLLSSNDGGVWGEDPTGVDDTVVLRSTDINITGDWNIDDPALRSLTQSEKRAKTLQQGDLVVVKSSGSEAHLGKTAIVTSAVADLGACYANFVQRLRPRDTKDAKFLWYFLNSDLASKELDRLGNTTTGLRNLNGESLGSIRCPWPDNEIRNTVCEELDRRVVTSNSLLSALEGQISLLRERRQALITAAVTGEIQISEFAG
jgi:type I restriction enzyme S subunit